ncbi:hypothetical protein [Metabacillus arenae]|uniref:Uncharacterized protein n=1 Tax=Metabacillus arenae TaxID=2771434 RepID=A0A926RW50_9BACI|nr:hypothetical protein [Metabacillus arenae]MBD1379190.1 hypothetical protein [Metabacillus arenae]
MNKKTKSIYFNLNDPFDSNLYEYSQQYPNFSKFVKRLIQNHINGINPSQKIYQDEQIIQAEEAENNPKFDTSLMKNLL